MTTQPHDFTVNLETHTEALDKLADLEDPVVILNEEDATAILTLREWQGRFRNSHVETIDEIYGRNI